MDITIRLTQGEVEAAIVAYAIRSAGIKLNDVTERVEWAHPHQAAVVISQIDPTPTPFPVPLHLLIPKIVPPAHELPNITPSL